MRSIAAKRFLRSACLLLGLVCCTAAFAQQTLHLAVQPGETVERTFGAAELFIHVSEKLARVDVEIRLGDRVVGTHSLTPSENTFPIDLRSANMGIRGSLIARFGYAQRQSYLFADFTVTDGQKQLPFRGNLAAWAWPAPVISKHSTVWLTPELNADIDLLLDQNQSVEVRFLTAGQMLLSITLSQGANDVLVKQGYQVGTVRIRPGMTLRLEPATPVQLGEVFLRGVFRSSNHPRVRYKGALVGWTYAQVSASEERTKESRE